MMATISRQCEGNMHYHCRDEGCACTVCHNTCGICGRPCHAVHQVADSDLLPEGIRGVKACATCYLAAMSVVPRAGCEGCGGPKGYRSPNDKKGRYLCNSCRAAIGLPSENRPFN